MLHTKDQGLGPSVPEKIFEGFLQYMGMAASLVMRPRCPEQTFVPPTHEGSTWNLALTALVVLEKIFENSERTDANGRTTEHAYTISSPMNLKAQVS